MSLGYFFLFTLMLVPAFLAMAIASRSSLALFWNFAWYLIFAQVGLKAFGSEWGAVPALAFALNYGFRAMRQRERRPKLDVRLWNFVNPYGKRPAQSAEAAPQVEGEATSARKAKAADEVIDAEFREL
ncbi:MAG TPA: hypothetical protein VM901_01455 [Bdellovibrionota bacterium]|jgi:hypothetical protein|nr:hypothetical protein [Bdellovibrionota bacterium]